MFERERAEVAYILGDHLRSLHFVQMFNCTSAIGLDLKRTSQFPTQDNLSQTTDRFPEF